MAKRKYTRRTDEELIEELQDKIKKVQERMEAKQRKDSAVLKELPKVQRALKRFAQLAVDHGREDLSNSTLAFLAGLERAAQTPPESTGSPRRGRGRDSGGE
jgi:molecular chaperone GrpE (heat shock protein)